MKIAWFPILLSYLVYEVLSTQNKNNRNNDKVRIHLNTVENKQHHLDLYFLLKTAHEKLLLEKVFPPQKIVHKSKHKKKGNHHHKSLEPFNKNFETKKMHKKSQTHLIDETRLQLKNIKNIMYFGIVQFGTQPKNNFNVIFDTGSSITFVTSVNCQSIGCQNTRNKYDPTLTNSQTAGKQISVTFGSGKISGILRSDVAQVQKYFLDDITFLEVLRQDGEVFQEGLVEGLVGLAFKEMFRIPTVFDKMKDQYVTQPLQSHFQGFQHNIFSFHLSRQLGESQSQIIFGSFDSTLIEGTWNFNPVINRFYWMIEAEQIRWNYRDTGICSQEKKCKFIIDTGTTIITGPAKDVKRLLQMVDINEKCKGFYEMPKLIFKLNGIDYELLPEEYAVTMQKNRIAELFKPSPKEDIEGCAAAILPLDIGNVSESIWIIGNIFLSKYSALFDHDNSRIGLARSLI